MTSFSLDGVHDGSPIKVLLVDDDEDSYLLTRRMLLQLHGAFVMEWAPSFAAGLEAVARLPRFLVAVA